MPAIRRGEETNRRINNEPSLNSGHVTLLTVERTPAGQAAGRPRWAGSAGLMVRGPVVPKPPPSATTGTTGATAAETARTGREDDEDTRRAGRASPAPWPLLAAAGGVAPANCTGGYQRGPGRPQLGAAKVRSPHTRSGPLAHLLEPPDPSFHFHKPFCILSWEPKINVELGIQNPC